MLVTAFRMREYSAVTCQDSSGNACCGALYHSCSPWSSCCKMIKVIRRPCSCWLHMRDHRHQSGTNVQVSQCHAIDANTQEVRECALLLDQRTIDFPDASRLVRVDSCLDSWAVQWFDWARVASTWFRTFSLHKSAWRRRHSSSTAPRMVPWPLARDLPSWASQPCRRL
jgi:hypothetical protein